MDIKKLLEDWKENNQGLSFADYKKMFSQLEQDPTPENQGTQETTRVSNSISPEPKLVKKRGWMEHHINCHVYLSKWVYDKLKNQKTISNKINTILMDYFTKEQPEESGEPEE